MALQVGETEYTDMLTMPPNDTYLNSRVPYFLTLSDILLAVPIGSINIWTTNVVPNTYMLCDGSPISRTTYKSLFNIIGTLYGAGDGATTFNLPNLLNKVVRGLDTVAPYNTLGNTGGADTVTLNANNLPAHIHAVNDPGHTHVITDPGHVHSFNMAYQNSQNSSSTGTSFGRAATNGSIVSDTKATGVALVGNVTGVTVGNNTTTGTAVSVVNPFITLNYIIKVQ